MASQRERLLKEYDALEDAVDGASLDEVWALADWLKANVLSEQGARNDIENRRAKLTLADLAERRGRSVQHLRAIRKTAEVTASDRLPGVSVSAYGGVLAQHGWDLAKANAALRRRGPKMRDHGLVVPSVKSIRAQLQQRTPEERGEIVAEAVADPEVYEAVQAKFARTPRLRTEILANELEAARRRNNDPLPPTREQFDAIHRRPSTVAAPAPKPDPWDELSEAHRLLVQARRIMTKESWELFEDNPDMLAAIARDAAEDAEFLLKVAEAARLKCAQAQAG